MKLTKEQLAHIAEDMKLAGKEVADHPTLSKLIAAFDQNTTALLAHTAEQDKELAEREWDMRSFNEAAKFSTELIASLTKELEHREKLLVRLANSIIKVDETISDPLIGELVVTTSRYIRKTGYLGMESNTPKAPTP